MVDTYFSVVIYHLLFSVVVLYEFYFNCEQTEEVITYVVFQYGREFMSSDCGRKFVSPMLLCGREHLGLIVVYAWTYDGVVDTLDIKF